MTFYKLTLVGECKDIYVNPKSIMCYIYEDNNVDIFLNGGDYITVDKSDFENMMILEGAREYWNTQQSTEFQ